MAENCKGKVCPQLSRTKLVKCIEHQCAHYQHLTMRNPQSGEVVDQWDCAFNWQTILLIENAQETRQAAAAVESARNESVTHAQLLAGGLAGIAEAARSANTLTIEQLPARNFRALENKEQQQ